MNKYFVLSFFCVIQLNFCQDKKDILNTSSLNNEPVSINDFQANYIAQLDSIKSIKKGLLKKYKSCQTLIDKKIVLKKTEELFISALNNVVFPAWDGNDYSFYGRNEYPHVGGIACGYFVTSSLANLGFKLDRSALAEDYSENMIKQLCSKKYIYRCNKHSVEQFEKSIIQMGKGIYIVGLDMHTGFIYCDGKEATFIHANMTGVMGQPLKEGDGLTYSVYRIVGKISSDEVFLERWLLS